MVGYEFAILNKARDALPRQGSTSMCVTYLSYIPKRYAI